MKVIQEQIEAEIVEQVLEGELTSNIQINLDGSAQPSQVLSNSTFYNTTVKEKRIGTMPIYDGAVEIEPSIVEQTLETAGKYNENDIVAKPVTSAIDGNIVSENIKSGITILNVTGKNTVVDTEENINAMLAIDLLKDKIGYVNGQKIIGELVISVLDAYEDYLRTYDSGFYKKSLASGIEDDYTNFWLELTADYVDKLNNGGLV